MHSTEQYTALLLAKHEALSVIVVNPTCVGSVHYQLPLVRTDTELQPMTGSALTTRCAAVGGLPAALDCSQLESQL